MSLLSLVLPTIGQPDSTEDVKLNTALTAIQTWANGNVDGTNLSAAAAQSAIVNQSGQVVKGSSVVATSQSTSSTSYTTLGTADQVSNIVLPATGLIAVAFQGTWQESVNNAAKAAIFIGSNQLQSALPGGPGAQYAITDGSSPANPLPLFTSSAGLISASGSISFTGDVTTGQLVGGAGTALGIGVGGANLGLGTQAVGGPCYVFASAGTYTVSVQFKVSSGSVTASNRKLWAWALSFV